MKLKKIAALVLGGAICLSALTGCGMDANKTVATLGEETVSVGIANFLCKYQKAQMDDVYMQYYGKDMWSQDLYGTGSTMEEDMRNSIMESLHDLYTVKAHMADYNVELTEEEQQKIKDATVAFMEANTEEALEEMSATKEVVEELLTLYTIQWKMYESIIVDADTEVSDEEANMRGYTLISVGIAGKYDDAGTYKAYTESEIVEIKANVKKAKQELAEKDWETVAKEYGFDIQSAAYGKDDATFDKELLTAMDALKEGEVSEIIETDDVYYIVRIDSECDKEATEENRLSIIEERENALYKEVLTGWQKDDEWTVNEKVLDTIEFHHILTQQAETQKSETQQVEATEE